MHLLKIGAVSLSMALTGLGAAQAATVNIFTMNGNAQETQFGIRAETGTNGSDLFGALITATYLDGTSEQVVWERTYRSSEGIASGADIGLYMRSGPIEIMANRTLTSLLFQLAPASTIFDMRGTLEGRPGNTPTTKRGVPFSIATGGDLLDGIINVTYSGIVNLAGMAAQGDAFTDMLIDYSGLTGGGFLGTMSINGDMDTLAVAGDLSPVPLPASLPALAMGLGAMGLFRTRKTPA